MFMTKVRGLLAAPLFAAAGLVSVSAPDTASAMPIANAFVQGSYSIATDPQGTPVSEFDSMGSFGGTLLVAPPYGPGPYRFSAALTLGTAVVFAGSTVQVLSAANISDILNFGTSAANAIAANNGATANVPDPSDPSGTTSIGTATYNITNFMLTSNSISGDYKIDLDLEVPIGPLVDGQIAQALNILGLSPTTLGGFTFPSNTSGTFRLDLAVAAVPLPATLPMLGAGGLLLVVLRRRAKSKSS